MRQSHAIEHPRGRIEIEEIAAAEAVDGVARRRIRVITADPREFSPRREWTTRYPLPLIEAILRVKSPAYLCDEIARDEDPEYVQADLEAALFSYVARAALDRGRVLDFGCGSGSSTVILGRLFPRAEILGVELDANAVEVARLRARHHRLDNVRFLPSPGPDRLPAEVDRVDWILLSAVWEHLLPDERPRLLAQIWARLSEGGFLFLNQTPDRRFPVEPHTTGLPLLNYLPDGWTHRLACRFSRRVARDASWEWLLRLGIRGGTPREIAAILRRAERPSEGGGEEARRAPAVGNPQRAPRSSVVVLRPSASGIRRQSDIWYRCARARLGRRFGGARRALVFAGMAASVGLGVPVAPYLSLAFRKGPARPGGEP